MTLRMARNRRTAANGAGRGVHNRIDLRLTPATLLQLAATRGAQTTSTALDRCMRWHSYGHCAS